MTPPEWRVETKTSIGSGANDGASVPLKWAHDAETGAARYIHDTEVVDERRRCLCPACQLPLTPVNAGKPQGTHPTPHFRHPEGSRKDNCMLIAARLAITRQLAEIGIIELSITLRRSKTDPTGKGRVVALPSAARDLCPVKAMKAWLALLDASSVRDSSDVVFRRIDRHSNIGAPLGAAAIGPILRARMTRSGATTTGFSAHSLRAGLVTSAALAGVPIWSIQRQTGHRSEAMVNRYIRDLSLFQANAFRTLSQAQS